MCFIMASYINLLYKLRSNTTYTESVITLDNRKDQNYEESKKKQPIGVHFRKLEQRYIKHQRGREEPPGRTTPVVGY